MPQDELQQQMISKRWTVADDGEPLDVYMFWSLFREAVDKSQDELQWQVDLEDEVEEAREEHADEYARKMLLYKEQMDKWEKQQEAKVCGQRM